MATQQREIKFRAWDKYSKSFVRLTVNSDPGETVVLDQPDDLYLPFQPAGRFSMRLIWKQYTTRKDKNGVEIYEGDVVAITLPNGKSWRTGVVVWKDFGFGIDTNRKNVSGLMPLPAQYRIEVIGNIHENPELVEGK